MLIWKLILVQVATFIFIIIFLKWLFYSQIQKALKRLQQLNKANSEKEKALKREIERAKRKAEMEVKKGKEQAKQIREEAEEEAEGEKESIVEEAEEEAEKIIGRAKKEAEKGKKELKERMKEKSVNVAAEMIKYLFTEAGLKTLHFELIDELIEKLDDIDKERFDMKEDKIKVISTYKLKNEQKENLKSVFSNKFDRDYELKEELDSEIIAGLIVKIGGVVVDGSVENKLNKIVPIMKEEIMDKEI